MAKKKKSIPNEDLIGRKFHWSEPWEWGEDEVNPLDENGNKLHNISGIWDVQSVHEEDDGETAWVHIKFQNNDYEMEFPTSIIRHNLVYDKEKDG